jgi:Carboxypeptidase regulatory-like domain/TonB-dependent Receptor Plug Domain
MISRSTNAICKAIFLSLISLGGIAFPVLFAQNGTSSITGIVTDAGGAVITNATITVTDLDTNGVVNTASDSAGAYDVPGLGPHHFDVTVTAPGFERSVRSGLLLTVAQVVRINFALTVGAVSNEVLVQGATPLLETATSAISGLVGTEQISQLPLNGRDLSELVLLQAGVSPTPSSGPSSFQKGGYAKFAVNGQRSTSTNYTIDGIDANDPDYATTPGGVSGEFLGVDGIREFRVFTSNYSAEYGRNAGAIVQMITKSGTNAFHGSAYEYFRNSALDAKNYFDLASDRIPGFARNQFGGSGGGPVQKDRTFFFLNYEGFRESQGQTSIATVPDALALRGYLPAAGNTGPCAGPGAPGCVQIPINSQIAPFIKLYPVANGVDYGNGTAQITTAEHRVTREDYGLARLDHTFSSSHSGFIRYVIDDGAATVPYLSTLAPGFPGTQLNRNQYFTVQDQRSFGAKWLNQAAFGLNRTAFNSSVPNIYPNLSISLVPGRAVGTFSVGGLSTVGNNLIYPLTDYSNVFQEKDNVTATFGRHTITFGGGFTRTQINGPFDLFVNGEYVFADLSAFGVAAQSSNAAFENFLKAVPEVYVGVQPNAFDSDRGYRQWSLDGYVQDNWAVTPKLTINAGLRYEFNSNPTESKGKEVNIINVATDTSTTVGKIMKTTPKDLIGPRIGFAYKLGSDDKTVIRGGGGLYYDQIWGNIYGNVRSLPPFVKAVEAILPQFLNPLNAVSIATTANAILTYTPDWPQVLQYNLSVERQLTASSIGKLAYVGTRGNHLGRLGDENPYLDSLKSRINPNFGSIERYVTDAQSFYNSLQASFETRFTNSLTSQVNYTFAHAIDDSPGYNPSDVTNEPGTSQNFFDRRAERGRGSSDIRHNLTSNFIYQLPFGNGKRFGAGAGAMQDKVIGGWQLASISSFHSNVPFTAVTGFDNANNQSIVSGQRPNIVGNPHTGTCPNGAHVGTVSCWFNPSAFALPVAGAYGDLGRNALPGPRYADFDFSVIKDTHITEQVAMEFKAELFNLFNHANFAVPTNTVGPNGAGGNGDAIFQGRDTSGNGVLVGNAGGIFSTVGSSRQVQFSLRMLF